MAYEATHWAWKLKLPGQRTSTTKFVLVALADMADESYSCFPGQERLASMVDSSVETVARSLRLLEQLGLLERQRRYVDGGYRTSDRYILQVGAQPREEAYPASAEVTYPASGGVLPGMKPDLTRHLPGRNHQRITSEAPDLVATEAEVLRAPASFDELWQVYPRRVGKEAARKAFAKASRSADPAVIIEAARVFAADPNLPEKQFVPHPATWLNRGSWEDEPLPQRDGRQGAPDDDPELAWLADRS